MIEVPPANWIPITAAPTVDPSDGVRNVTWALYSGFVKRKAYRKAYAKIRAEKEQINTFLFQRNNRNAFTGITAFIVVN
jgi:hypothetical protein